jgi:hypothetical protein
VVVVSSWHPLWGWFYWKYTPIALAFSALAFITPYLSTKPRSALLLTIPVLTVTATVLAAISDKEPKTFFALLAVLLAASVDSLGVALLRRFYKAAADCPPQLCEPGN